MLREKMRFQPTGSRQLFLTMLVWLIMLCLLQAAFAVETEEGSEDKDFSTEQIEQLVAPIALYPDALLAQILMASTYPLEIVRAARWVEENPDVTGDALEDAMEKQSWDTSVKSLTA